MGTCSSVLNCLNSAGNWATFDLFSDSMITDFAKHSKLDEAQHLVYLLQTQLQDFRTELADVTVYVNLDVNIRGFERFADYFFDNIFTDWAVKSKISRSIASASQTRYQISLVLDRLDQMDRDADREQEELQSRYDRIVSATGPAGLESNH